MPSTTRTQLRTVMNRVPRLITLRGKEGRLSEHVNWADESASDLPLAQASIDLDAAILDEITASVEIDGYTIVDLSQIRSRPHALIQVLGAIGEPIKVFRKFPFWKPIGVDLQKDPTRSEGVGAGPFHMDFVNASRPPRFVCLYCERVDPQGGGLSALSDLEAAMNRLSVSDVAALKEPAFRDGRVSDLDHVGTDINPFAVITADSNWPYRFTGSISYEGINPMAATALESLAVAIDKESIEFLVPAGSALIFDNRRFVHARRALGQAQEEVVEEKRRMLLQGFSARH